MAAWSHAAKIYAGYGGPRYAAHVGFFPFSNFGFAGIELTGAPVLFLVGRDDDWTPLETIQRLVGYWKGLSHWSQLVCRRNPTLQARGGRIGKLPATDSFAPTAVRTVRKRRRADRFVSRKRV